MSSHFAYHLDVIIHYDFISCMIINIFSKNIIFLLVDNRCHE